ncbi:uncharacterized protein LOC123689414 [Pieris rapae]|uniref:uncharacterized protein LOC123689414 n=1 Tax=Pieris rapae TaxID=64459 RepID=UPI001E27BFB0|nr:uncharacterized protein LOC123689414 [Pieris rapae]
MNSKVCFIPSSRGKHPMLILEKYTYKRQWELKFISSGHGKHPRMLYKDYTFKRQRKSAEGIITWYCSSRNKGSHFITTPKGGQVLIIGENRFHKEYGKEDRSYWRCSKRLKYGYRSAHKITETVTLDNGNVSDDDVIEVVIDDTPIEILSDEEEMQLEKTRASVIEQSFEFTAPQTPETSFNERKDIIDPLTSFAPIGDNQSILETHITSTMSINETDKESPTTEVEVNVDKTFIETPEVKNTDEPKDDNEENSVLSDVEKLNVPCQSNELGTVITEPVIN